MLAFLSSEQVTSKRVAAFVTHKPFMVVAKYCDLVLEPSFRNAGVDFYKRGVNIATANLLTTTMPVFLNPTTWSNFLSLFVRVVRERTPSLFDDWRRSAELIFSHLEHTHRKAADFFTPVFLMRDCSELFKTLGDDELDPLVPAYYVVVDHWGTSVGDIYEVIADESKILAKARGLLLALSDPNLKPVTVGYDRRRTEFPLKVSDIIAVDSTLTVRFSLRIYSAEQSRAQQEPKQRARCAPARLPTMSWSCAIQRTYHRWALPNHEVDPKDLETDIVPGPEDFNLPDIYSDDFERRPSTKNNFRNEHQVLVGPRSAQARKGNVLKRG